MFYFAPCVRLCIVLADYLSLSLSLSPCLGSRRPSSYHIIADTCPPPSVGRILWSWNNHHGAMVIMFHISCPPLQ
uniref:Putative secreted protein n=1 Tax=Anopheles darlingi TaxID=43151 RepID=A0A2M4DCA8_ANODA